MVNIPPMSIAPKGRHASTGIVGDLQVGSRAKVGPEQKPLEVARVKELRLYDLRHGFATAALESGTGVRTTADLMGHANTRNDHGGVPVTCRTPGSGRPRSGSGRR